MLVERGAVSPTQLHAALRLQQGLDAPLGEILVANGHVGKADILTLLAEQYNISVVEPDDEPAQSELWAQKPREFWFETGTAPYRRLGPLLQIATETALHNPSTEPQ